MGERKITAEEKLRLAADPEFQRIFAADPELARLDASRYGEEEDFFVLAAVLRWPLAVGNIPLFPLTAAKWSFLWSIGNAFARNGAMPGASDADVFLYVLSHDLLDLGCTPAELPAKAAGYGAASGLDLAALENELKSMCRIAFHPLSMLPRGNSGQEEERFDADWLLRVADIAAQASGHTSRDCMLEMSLAELCGHFVVDARNKRLDGQRIRRQLPEEVEMQIMKRTRKLQLEYLERQKN